MVTLPVCFYIYTLKNLFIHTFEKYFLIYAILDKLQEQNADSHLLIFDIPITKADEEFLSAELRILTIVQADSMLESGKNWFSDISKSIFFI